MNAHADKITTPSDATFLWKVMHFLLHWVIFPFCCRLTVTGRRHVPPEGGCLIASNHNPGPDYVILGYASPRQVFYMAKSEIFESNPLLAKFLQQIGTFPVRRGERDLAAVSGAMELVEQEHVLGMFPEGTRSRTGMLGRGKSGVSRIAMQTGAPVVPAVVLNSEQIFKRFWPQSRPEIVVRFGEPLYCEGDPSDTATVKANTRRIMLAIAELLPPERRGSYAEALEAAQAEPVSETPSAEAQSA